jgi:type I restriction enzyme M protein
LTIGEKGAILYDGEPTGATLPQVTIPGMTITEIKDAAGTVIGYTIKYGDNEPVNLKLISEKLQGLVFIPDFYYQGIEAMAANTFYYKALTLPTVNANDDFSTDKATEGKTFSLTPNLVANYHLNPSNAAVSDLKKENMFFIAFNKYTGKADKNQAFTPDHITEFMCRATGVDRTKRVLDATCGSGSFLVQAMVKELADCRRGKREEEAKDLMRKVKEEHIYGIEVEENAYGLSTTNMLIHGDGNSNIKFGSCFDCKEFIKDANPDIILMNPPYNAKPIGIPAKYKASWGNSKNGKEDPTKGFVFVHYLSDVIKEMNDKREKDGKPRKTVKMAVLLPVATAIGTKSIIQNEKIAMLENNTLEAVFTLPNEIFYPGASASACCMVFTLGEPHVKVDGTTKETFFGYYKEDGFKKKKNLGRVEQFDDDGNSKWKAIEEEWLRLFRNHKSVAGLSATAEVTGKDEWLCEAYMKTDYTKLREEDFQRTLNSYLAYLIKEGKIYES